MRGIAMSDLSTLLAKAEDAEAAEFGLREIWQNAETQHGHGVLRCHFVASTVYVWNDVEATGAPCAGIGLRMLSGIQGRRSGARWVAAIHLDRCRFQELDLEALLA